ncbi:DNA-methyltransferase [Burkholderia cenocepacia]|uniref:DNA-methyltransferase n=1 Tax=Burkholderia cenocepacia TaxID=95486 RepID=UPI0009B2BA3D|nr:site-specific DNA-methyltransferase [Burkholderia cenocepacia]MBR7941392.1 site-specific DNA-methyltransferase [Burkholderia cenocepacia]
MTDPPYLISNPSVRDTGTFKDLDARRNFGDWDTKDDGSLPITINHAKRILVPGGRVVCFYDFWKVTHLRDMLIRNAFKQLRLIQWRKENPMPIGAALNTLAGTVEMAVTAVKGRNATFNAYGHDGMFYADIVRSGRLHPTQKPLSLVTEIIRIFTNPGDIVLDCYAGSGTTGVASVQTGRHFVGCERDWQSFEAAEQRIFNPIK